MILAVKGKEARKKTGFSCLKIFLKIQSVDYFVKSILYAANEEKVKVARPSFFLAIPNNFETLILKGIDVNDKTTTSHALHID